MTSASFITLLLAAATHVACLTIALLVGPSNESFPVLILAWLSVPSTISAIGLAPRWLPVIPAAINGLIAALIVDTLLLGFSYFWPFQPRETQIELALAYLLLFPAIAAICGAFVAIVIGAIEKTNTQPACVVGTRKGSSFAGICGVISLPVFILLLPATDGPAALDGGILVVSVSYIVGSVLVGTIVGALTGCSYQLLRHNLQRTQGA